MHQKTVERAAEIGVPVVNVPGWYDVDDAGSLALLQAEFAGEPLAFAPRGCRRGRARDARAFCRARHARGSAGVMTDLALAAPDRRPRRLHPLALRIMHWINALAMIIMIGSGWEIYNDEVIFGWLHFPRLDDDRRRARRARCNGISPRCGS